MFYYIKDTPHSLYWEIIPKNGSTSILSTFLSYDKNTTQHFKEPYAAIPDKIIALNKNKKYFLNNVLDYEKTFFLIVLRDPYKRVVSAFLNKIVDNYDSRFFKPFYQKYGTDLFKFQNNKEYYFDKFVEMIESEENPKNIDRHIQKQVDFIDEKILNANKKIIINLENIASNWKDLQDLFPKIPNLLEAKQNASNSQKFCELINFKHIDKILHLYKEDYNLLSAANYDYWGLKNEIYHNSHK